LNTIIPLISKGHPPKGAVPDNIGHTALFFFE
jgi:hypothetical protein